ncbi:SAM-dependent methyltransferase [Panacagrimonas perspica]|uniref:SAM-dependent methyltransferase n=1 Tax=Panacagrimonas perspica TaxID=381431 RepID=A0A4S3K8U9_9GAMM|nr:class I SAM-dependent rRNA methyltransferase [Panacagrimonas perspica]TDU24303.1 SAM-dependent methyltransferase [Panacagrimonas perspica]THD04703.1 rRNA large subunit methyltransferase I [Panacagrimonas perspica]
MSESLPTLRLNPNAERRLRVGHSWVFSNEVDTAKTPLKALKAGDLVNIVDSRGKAVGTAYANPNSLIAARLLSSRADAVIDLAWLTRRLAAARAMRDSIYPTPHYRLVYGEADGLPGLVVDRFGDICVVQTNTAGMDRLQPLVIQALQAELQPRGILLRNDGSSRTVEGLPEAVEAIGEVPDSVELVESGVRFKAPVRHGQKTGWFFDQHDNRDRFTRYVREKRVLDVFSYVGAWGIRAMVAGATSATCVDSSQPALDAVVENAALNGVEVEALKGDALDRLKSLRADGRTFDVVVVDPPALIKRRKDHDAGLEHYAALNRAAMQLLVPGGVLVACSCSFHLEESELQRILLREARAQNRQLQILEQGGQGPDHPVHPAIVETRYLKAFYCRVN